MGFLKKILGNYMGGHHGKSRSGHGGYGGNKHQGGYSNNTPLPTTTCPKCQTFLEPGARFCSQCGTNLQGNKCSCGAFLEANAQFCMQCGKPRS